MTAHGLSIIDRLTYTVTENGCWLWGKGVSNNGYGKLKIAGKWYKAHRLMYELHVGSIPDDLEIDHQCHNQDAECAGGHSCVHRRCINPDHLRATTHKINANSGRLRGRDVSNRVRNRVGQFLRSERT